jgi:hypothetical protein
MGPGMLGVVYRNGEKGRKGSKPPGMTGSEIHYGIPEAAPLNEEPKSKLEASVLAGIFFLRSMDFMRGFIPISRLGVRELKPEQAPGYEPKLDLQFDAILRCTDKDRAIIYAIDSMYRPGNNSSSSVKAKLDPYYTRGGILWVKFSACGGVG